MKSVAVIVNSWGRNLEKLGVGGKKTKGDPGKMFSVQNIEPRKLKFELKKT